MRPVAPSLRPGGPAWPGRAARRGPDWRAGPDWGGLLRARALLRPPGALRGPTGLVAWRRWRLPLVIVTVLDGLGEARQVPLPVVSWARDARQATPLQTRDGVVRRAAARGRAEVRQVLVAGRTVVRRETRTVRVVSPERTAEGVRVGAGVRRSRDGERPTPVAGPGAEEAAARQARTVSRPRRLAVPRALLRTPSPAAPAARGPARGARVLRADRAASVGSRRARAEGLPSPAEAAPVPDPADLGPPWAAARRFVRARMGPRSLTILEAPRPVTQVAGAPPRALPPLRPPEQVPAATPPRGGAPQEGRRGVRAEAGSPGRRAPWASPASEGPVGRPSRSGSPEPVRPPGRAERPAPSRVDGTRPGRPAPPSEGATPAPARDGRGADATPPAGATLHRRSGGQRAAVPGAEGSARPEPAVAVASDAAAGARRSRRGLPPGGPSASWLRPEAGLFSAAAPSPLSPRARPPAEPQPALAEGEEPVAGELSWPGARRRRYRPGGVRAVGLDGPRRRRAAPEAAMARPAPRGPTWAGEPGSLGDDGPRRSREASVPAGARSPRAPAPSATPASRPPRGERSAPPSGSPTPRPAGGVASRAAATRGPEPLSLRRRHAPAASPWVGASRRGLGPLVEGPGAPAGAARRLATRAWAGPTAVLLGAPRAPAGSGLAAVPARTEHHGATGLLVAVPAVADGSLPVAAPGLRSGRRGLVRVRGVARLALLVRGPAPGAGSEPGARPQRPLPSSRGPVGTPLSAGPSRSAPVVGTRSPGRVLLRARARPGGLPPLPAPAGVAAAPAAATPRRTPGRPATIDSLSGAWARAGQQVLVASQGVRGPAPSTPAAARSPLPRDPRAAALPSASGRVASRSPVQTRGAGRPVAPAGPPRGAGVPPSPASPGARTRGAGVPSAGSPSPAPRPGSPPTTGAGRDRLAPAPEAAPPTPTRPAPRPAPAPPRVELAQHEVLEALRTLSRAHPEARSLLDDIRAELAQLRAIDRLRRF